MLEKIKPVSTLIKRSFLKYKKDDPVKLAGTTAYFTIFAVAPILIIIISIIGLLMGEENISQKVYQELQSLIGPEGTGYIKTLVTNFQDRESNILGTIIGVVVFLVGSTTFFTILQGSLNFVWKIRAKPSRNWLKTLKDRLLSFGLILSLGFILLVSLLVDAGLAVIRDFITGQLPDFTLVLVQVINYIFSFGVIVLIFALIFKFLPDAIIRWKVVWMGALITALLFTLGKFLIGYLLGNSGIGVMYGAAGSLVIILLWVFYSSIIFFFGAEITQQYAEMYSHKIIPKENVVRIEIREIDKD